MHTEQSKRVQESELATHDRDVYRKRQRVDASEHLLEAIRRVVREEIRAELMARDRRSGSGD